ncbi:hypothetical protein CL614_06565 [archaeon]|jgi:hypothetical protein|nr:hypothetical protein [archaeon]|tara:strand:- start:445 stop:630 length:186 start_codon:yes stop_codon:yes gene_type:complete
MKIYRLIIGINEETDEIEFLEESLEEDKPYFELDGEDVLPDIDSKDFDEALLLNGGRIGLT